ncbi:SH3 domain-containing protein [candidate division KSB1 bacterium]|nr:SH3 domain-containing protein [candidate division KSB1 bacterium]
MKRTIWMVMILIMASMAWSQNYARRYIGIPQENLRSGPNGKKIGVLLEGTEMAVLEEKDNWVRVAVTGWIWKPSLVSYVPKDIEGKMRALHILTETREQAEKALSRIKAGEDFGEVAREISILPNAERGGDLGYFSKGDFAPKVENSITSLEVGEVSDIIQTDFGFNIFKRLK